MQIRRLALHQLRRFSAVNLSPQPGLNLLTGDNGAGKTSVLEALHLMAYGRSFRGRVRDGLVRQGQEALEIFVEWDEQRANHPPHRRKAGLRHSGQDWKGRLDGEDVAQLGNLCAALAVVTFEPEATHWSVVVANPAAASSIGACSTWNRIFCPCGAATPGR